MEMNPGALPRPGRVPAQEFCPPKLDGDGGGDRNCFWRKGVWNQGFRNGRIHRIQRGHRGGAQGSQEGARRALGGWTPGTLLGPWWVHSLPSLVLREASGTLIFYIIFRNLFGTFNGRTT